MCSTDWRTELVLEMSIATVTKLSIYPIAAGSADQWWHTHARYF